MVALVYRHLATQGSALTWAWGALAPIMRSGDLPSAAREIVSVASFPVVQNINDKNLIEFDLLDTDINKFESLITRITQESIEAMKNESNGENK